MHGARVMARDASGLSPLHYATERGFHECANAMQRYGGGSSALARPVLSPSNKIWRDGADGPGHIAELVTYAAPSILIYFSLGIKPFW